MLTLLLCYAALCDPHFDRREAATARLSHLIDRHPALYGPRLGDWCRGATCPEVRSRSLRVLGGYVRWRAASYVPRGVPAWPCIDMMPVANPWVPFGLAPDVRDRHAGSPWLPRCRPPWMPESMERGPWWGRYRAGTEAMVRERLREGASIESMDCLIGRMWEIECRAKHDCGAVLDAGGWTGGYLR